jgi:hypothetical protein
MANVILILIKSNPLKSHRSVEAIRIGLGLASGEHTVQIVLLDQAPLLLGEDAEDLVDGELLSNYLPTFKEWGQTFYVEENAWQSAHLNQTEYKTVPIPMSQIAELIQQAGRFMIF